MAVLPPPYDEAPAPLPLEGIIPINREAAFFLAGAAGVSAVAIGVFAMLYSYCGKCPPCPPYNCPPCPPYSDCGWTLVGALGVYEAGKMTIKLGQLLIERIYPPPVPEPPPGLLRRLLRVIW